MNIIECSGNGGNHNGGGTGGGGDGGDKDGKQLTFYVKDSAFVCAVYFFKKMIKKITQAMQW